MDRQFKFAHIRQSKNNFIDGTWYRPKGFRQILIIEYKDIITKEKIIGPYIIMNKKNYNNFGNFSIYYITKRYH